MAFKVTVELQQACIKCHLEAQGSPHSGLTLGDNERTRRLVPVAGKNRAEPMMVLF